MNSLTTAKAKSLAASAGLKDAMECGVLVRKELAV